MRDTLREIGTEQKQTEREREREREREGERERGHCLLIKQFLRRGKSVKVVKIDK